MKTEYFQLWFINSFRPQILSLMLVYCWKLPRRSRFWVRLIVLSALFIFAPLSLLRDAVPILQPIWVSVGYPVITLCAAGAAGLMFRMSGKQMVFYSCLSLIFQHLAHCLSRMVFLVTDLFWWQLSYALFMALILLASILYLRDRFCDSDTAILKSGWALGFSAASIVTTCFVSYYTSNLEGETLGYYFYDIAFCVLLLIIMLDVFQKNRAEREHTIMLHLLKQEQEQNGLSRETADIINRKCHDLKHQISALRNMNEADREEIITELEKAVMLYENFIQSGNKDVDIILAEKNLVAEQKDIQLMCMVDGEKLDFLKPEDLYSLLGNALDNAIEAAEQEPDEEKRIIELRIFKMGIFTSIHIANPCRTELIFKDGLPITTKEDTDYHGFGMRSMRYVAEQYGGALTASWDDGIYSLDIVFPNQ